jgi:DNA ligase-1
VIEFARLFERIDHTTSTNAKVDAMAEYFTAAPPADAAWAVFFLTGRRLKRLIPSASIRDWTLAATGFDEWMIGECYSVVGDGAETAALMLDQVARPASVAGPGFGLAVWVNDRILPLKQLDPGMQQVQVNEWLLSLDRWQRFTLLKLLTGELRVGVSQTLVVRALAQAADLPTTTIAARLMGDWQPTAEWYAALMARGETAEDRSRPYPFYLASPLEEDITTLGDPNGWLIEWKWDGIRAQLIRRGDGRGPQRADSARWGAGGVHLWSRGEELITHRFPEIAAAATRLPDGTVLDGEVLAFRDDRPLPFSALQQRIGRQKLVAQMVRAVPVVFMTYDVLEHEGRDVRGEPLSWRRAALEDLLREASVLRTSARVHVKDWQELTTLRGESRARGVEGFMLKRLDSAYGVGRKRGDWWKWKIDPYTIDAVLIYAQPGSGKRASLLTDYTFGVWDEGTLVPIAKAYSGLSNEEIGELDKWIRRHTRERFGPVRHVEPVHVFELGFEAIAPSSRHKSGIAVRFPRMLRWRKDKPAAEADTLDAVKKLLESTRD